MTARAGRAAPDLARGDPLMSWVTRFYLASGAVVLALGTLAGSGVYAANSSDAELIERGRYLAVVGDCVACHTKPGGKPLAGGLPLQTPLGPIISTFEN
jgi:mono/diheme cytochrome c family protein